MADHFITHHELVAFLIRGKLACFDGAFLKEALAKVPHDAPFRGPSLYTRGEYTYHCQVTGDFQWFHGGLVT